MILGQVCHRKGFSKRVPAIFAVQYGSLWGEDVNMKKKKRKPNKDAMYRAFPLTVDMSKEKEILKSFFPKLTIAPSTSKKNIDTVYTKIKDKLEYTFHFNKVFSWKFPNDGCDAEFIAIARSISVGETVEET